MICDGTLYWITGLSGAGKTTIGTRFYYEVKKYKSNVILLDGDELKNLVADDVDYSLEGRRKRAMKYASLCKLLTDQGMVVICCTIAMFHEVREWNRKNNKGYVEVYLNVPLKILKQRNQKNLYSQYDVGTTKNISGIDVPVELPQNPDIEIVNDGTKSVQQVVEQLLNYEVMLSPDFKRDTDYWNQYYSKKGAPEKPSLFAEWILNKYIQNMGHILELGCGNGRDSVYFFKEGLKVTAIDASETSIQMLQEKYENENINFICDDFVCSSFIYCSQYDYIYSRFSLHAINEDQEVELMGNVYNALKKRGLFFIEVRSVNDELCGKGEKVGPDEYIYEEHYRRFIRMEKIKKHLVESGFAIVYSEEKRGFAPFGDANPPIIRIVATKAE